MAGTPPYVGTPTAQVGSRMEVNVYLDVAAALGSGQTVAAIQSATLTDSTSGADVTATSCVGSPTVSGTKLIQVVKSLTPGHNYLLTFLWTMTPADFTGEQLEGIQPIQCAY